jgi:hypothetical protein
MKSLKDDVCMSTKHNGFKNFRLEKKIHRAVDRTLRAYRMVQNGDAVLVAVPFWLQYPVVPIL